MKISNMSDAAIWVSENGAPSQTLPAKVILETTAKKVTIRVSHLPCTVEVEDGVSIREVKAPTPSVEINQRSEANAEGGEQ